MNPFATSFYPNLNASVSIEERTQQCCNNMLAKFAGAYPFYGGTIFNRIVTYARTRGLFEDSNKPRVQLLCNQHIGYHEVRLLLPMIPVGERTNALLDAFGRIENYDSDDDYDYDDDYDEFNSDYTRRLNNSPATM